MKQLKTENDLSPIKQIEKVIYVQKETLRRLNEFNQDLTNYHC